MINAVEGKHLLYCPHCLIPEPVWIPCLRSFLGYFQWIDGWKQFVSKVHNIKYHRVICLELIIITLICFYWNISAKSPHPNLYMIQCDSVESQRTSAFGYSLQETHSMTWNDPLILRRQWGRRRLSCDCWDKPCLATCQFKVLHSVILTPHPAQLELSNSACSSYSPPAGGSRNLTNWPVSGTEEQIIFWISIHSIPAGTT